MTMTTTIEDAFRQAIRDAGLTPPASIVADGALHRFPTNGKAGDDSGWYVLYGDGVPTGVVGDWRSNVKVPWCAKSHQHMTDAERTAYRQRIEKIQKEREEEDQHRHAAAAADAQRICNAASPATADHPYLSKKQVPPHDLRVHHDGRLIAPLSDANGTL